MNYCINLFKVLFFFLIIVFTSSCDQAEMFEENQHIDGDIWHKDDVKHFEVVVKDSMIPANFYINVRHTDDYPFSNLFLFFKTKFPNGKVTNDTLECSLANEKGQWLGKGMGDILENQIPFKRNVRFPFTGKYTFEIQHGMRADRVPLIMDVGLRIENIE